MSDAGQPQFTGELDERSRITLEEYISSAKNMAVISKKEATEKGLPFYWNGNPCPKGHYAKRRTKGGGCSACLYLANLLNNKLANARRATVRKQLREEKIQELEIKKLSPQERTVVLERYAETGDLEEGAAAINLTMPELNVQISRSASFATEVFALEKRLKAAGVKVKYVVQDIEWTPQMKHTLVRAYIDTGDIAAARDAVGASPTNLIDELEQDPEFAKKLKEAKPKAMAVLKEIAIQKAIKGDEKLITLLLKAEYPETFDRAQKIQVDQNTTIKLSDQQLNERIWRLADEYKNVIDVEFSESIGSDASGSQRAITDGSGRTESEKNKKQVLVHVPADGTIST